MVRENLSEEETQHHSPLWGLLPLFTFPHLQSRVSVSPPLLGNTLTLVPSGGSEKSRAGLPVQPVLRRASEEKVPP